IRPRRPHDPLQLPSSRRRGEGVFRRGDSPSWPDCGENGDGGDAGRRRAVARGRIRARHRRGRLHGRGARHPGRDARPMTRGPRPTPVAELTRHFFRELFYLRFLTDAGADSVRRTIIAIIAGLFSLTIFFPQLIVARYVALSGRPTPEPYRIALLG